MISAPIERKPSIQKTLALPLMALALTLEVPAQQAPPPSIHLDYRYDSGPALNPTSSPQVVISFPVAVEAAPWLRLEFAGVQLAGDPGTGSGSILRITSLLDAEVQELGEIGLGRWRRTSAYFNGDTVLVEVLAQPNTGANRVVLSAVVAGLQGPPGSPDNHCGVDPRIPSSDGRVGRLMPAGCTAFLIDDCTTCLLTAGHCAPGGSGVAQFNVPPSLSNGTLVNPSPDDQFPVDTASVQAQNGGVGADWAYFGCFANGLGQQPFDRQLARFALADPPPFNAADHIRITGHGTDSTPLTNNQVQQTSLGLWNSLSATFLTFSTFVEGGNSGSAVFHEETGTVIGITTHTSCPGGVQNNYGTRKSIGALQAALAAPTGICAGTSCSGIGTNYCIPGPRFSVISATGSASIAANDLVLHANNIPVNKTGIFMYSQAQQSVPFGNGKLCVGGGVSVYRLPGVSSGAGTTFTFPVNYNTLPAAGPITAGSTWNFQTWFRVMPGETETSDGLMIGFTG